MNPCKIMEIFRIKINNIQYYRKQEYATVNPMKQKPCLLQQYSNDILYKEIILIQLQQKPLKNRSLTRNIWLRR